MVIRDEVHGALADVPDDLSVDEVLLEGFLQENVAAVFFVLEDTPNAVVCPFGRVFEARDAALLQPCFYHPNAVPGEVAVVDPADHFRLLRNWLRPAIRSFAVAVQILVLDGHPASALAGPALAPGHIG